MHWTGKPQPFHGLLRIDGKPYRFMGADPEDVPAMEQTGLTVTPTHTIYDFAADGVKLTVTFFTPALPHDLDALSRPVTYLTLTASSDSAHVVSALIDVDPIIAVNTADEPVTWGRSRAGNLTVLNVGLARSAISASRRATMCASTGATSISRCRMAKRLAWSHPSDAMDQFVSSGSVPTQRRHGHAADAA